VSEIIEEPEQPEAAKAGVAWKFVALAYTLAWIPWIVCIKLHASEMMLNLGVAGPSLAALILLRRSRSAVPRIAAGRVLLFLLLVAGCSVILSLYYAWRTGPTLHLQWDPWSLIPSIAPAWIVSSALSRDLGIRELGVSLVRFNRWSLVGFFIFPRIIFVGDALARSLHQPLTMQSSNGSAANDTAKALVFFLYSIFFTAALEEPGWRGCLLPILQQRWSSLQSTLFVWFAWALWHLPLDLSRPQGFSIAQYLESRIVFLIPISIILTWLYNRGCRSIQACATFHASMDTFPFVFPYWMPSFALLFVIAGMATVRDRMWRRRLS